MTTRSLSSIELQLSLARAGLEAIVRFDFPADGSIDDMREIAREALARVVEFDEPKET